MAPFTPEDLDVYHAPHATMKKLVHKSVEMVTRTDYKELSNIQLLLKNLSNTFQVFQAHEQIENQVIISRLKEKMHLLSVHNVAVCNCHSDNKLISMCELFKSMYTCMKSKAQPAIDYINIEHALKQAMEDFTKDFIPHMTEEEEVFQPLLEKYFSPEELKEIKDTVIDQHLVSLLENDKGELKQIRDMLTSESSKYTVDSKDYRSDALDLNKNQVTIDPVASFVSKCIVTSKDQFVLGFGDLPEEIMVKIMSYLTPKELQKSSLVSKKWHRLCTDGKIWSCLLPVAWAKGIWSFVYTPDMMFLPQHDSLCFIPDLLRDEDEDIDESDDASKLCLFEQRNREAKIYDHLMHRHLPVNAWAVTKLYLACSRYLTSDLLCKLLELCSNLELLDVSFTSINDSAFKCCRYKDCCRNLKHLDVKGCVNLTSLSLKYLTSIQLFGGQKYLTDVVHSENGDVGIIRTSWLYRPPTNRSKTMLYNEQELSTHKQINTMCNHSDQSYRPNGNETKREVMKGSNISFESCLDTTQKYIMNDNRCKLEFLCFSGCYQITDDGLQEMINCGGLPLLIKLDFSGCPNITGPVLAKFISLSPKLKMAEVTYCDNIPDVPGESQACGCTNIDSATLLCCRSGLE